MSVRRKSKTFRVKRQSLRFGLESFKTDNEHPGEDEPTRSPPKNSLAPSDDDVHGR